MNNLSGMLWDQTPSGRPTAVPALGVGKRDGLSGFLTWFSSFQPAFQGRIHPHLPKGRPSSASRYRRLDWEKHHCRVRSARRARAAACLSANRMVRCSTTAAYTSGRRNRTCLM